jgi:hypothetical protein
MSKTCTRILAVLTVSVFALLTFPVADAFASSEITSAQANAGWTLGAIVGSASWGVCQHGGIEKAPGTGTSTSGCRLQPFVTVGTSACSAEERRWPHSKGNLTLAWSGHEYSGSGSESFDVSEVPLSGEPDQLACLTLLETYEERPYCQLHPEPGIACPMWIALRQNATLLDEASLTQASAAADTAEEPPTIDGESVSGIGTESATLEAQINPNSTKRGAYYQFQIAKDPGEFAGEFTCPTEGFPANTSLCLGVTAQEGALPIHATSAGTSDQAVSLDLESAGTTLEPGTTYYYRVIAAGIVPTEDTTQWKEPTVLGPSEEFTTHTTAPTLPSIVSESASNITMTDATLEAEIEPGSSNVGAYYQFQLAPFPAEFADEISCPPPPVPGLPACVGPQSATALPIGHISNLESPAHVSLDLADAGVTLSPGKTYYFRVVAANAVLAEDSVEWEHPVAGGQESSFTTPSSAVSDGGATPAPDPGIPTSSSDSQSTAPATISSASSPLHHRRRHRHHRRQKLARQSHRAVRAN